MQRLDHSGARSGGGAALVATTHDGNESFARESRENPENFSVTTGYKPRTGWRLGLAAGVAAVALMAGFVIVHRARSDAAASLEAAATAQAAAAPRVNFVRVRSAPATETLVLPAATKAWYRSTIYARVNGYVAAWLVDIGDHVRKGQVLARIDTPELDDQLAAEQAQLRAAQAEVKVRQSDADFARSTYERWRDSPKGVVSEQEREEKKAAYSSALAHLNAAQANVNLDQANLDRLATLTQFREVTAPFDGTIIDRRVDIGDLVTAGSTASTTPLYTLAQIDQLRVFVDVPQSAVVGIKVGIPCDIVASQYPDRVFKGRVTRTTDAIDNSARTLRVEVDIPNRDGALLPGMYVEASFELQGRGLLEVPASALVFRAGGPEVAVIDRDGRVMFRPVTIARDDGSVVEIGSGVTPDDRVVLNISNQITDGDKVTATEAERVAAAAAPAAAVPQR